MAWAVQQFLSSFSASTLPRKSAFGASTASCVFKAWPYADIVDVAVRCRVPRGERRQSSAHLPRVLGAPFGRL